MLLASELGAGEQYGLPKTSIIWKVLNNIKANSTLRTSIEGHRWRDHKGNQDVRGKNVNIRQDSREADLIQNARRAESNILSKRKHSRRVRSHYSQLSLKRFVIIVS